MIRFKTATIVLAAGLLPTTGVIHGGQQPVVEPQQCSEATRFRIHRCGARVDVQQRPRDDVLTAVAPCCADSRLAATLKERATTVSARGASHPP